MDLIGRVSQKASAALEDLCRRAEGEGWTAARIEQEKSLFMLRHEVSLCCRQGCLAMVVAVPGYPDLTCAAHAPGAGSRGGGGG